MIEYVVTAFYILILILVFIYNVKKKRIISHKGIAKELAITIIIGPISFFSHYIRVKIKKIKKVKSIES